MGHCQASHARCWTKNAACSIEVLLVCSGATSRCVLVWAMSRVSICCHISCIFRLFKATLHEEGGNSLLATDMDYFENA
jgi:hypothetical protein